MIASTTISRSARSSNTQSATSAPTFASPISRPGASSVHKIRDYQAGVKKSMHLIRSGAATHAQVRRFAQKIMATPQSWNAAVPLVRELRELPADHNEAVRILWNATKRLRNAQVKHPNPSDGQIRHLRVQQAETRARLECLLPNASVAQRGLITTIVDAWTMLLDMPCDNQDVSTRSGYTRLAEPCHPPLRAEAFYTTDIHGLSAVALPGMGLSGSTKRRHSDMGTVLLEAYGRGRTPKRCKMV